MSAPQPSAPLRSERLAQARVAVVGLGLMGGSLAGALKGRQACREVIGIPRRAETVAQALERGLIDRGTTDPAQGLPEADLVILAMPVRTILSSLPALGPLLPPGCLVLDLGSTKARIAAALNALPPEVHVCPAHPMCGKELAGLEAADADLYVDKIFVLSPLPRTTRADLALAEELVTAVGARARRMDPRRHDRLVAVGSHLPYLLALGLVATAEEVGREDTWLWDLVASGFRDTSRLAASDVRMMLDVLMTNVEAIGEAMDRFREHLEEMEHLLKEGDEAALRRILEAAAIRRSAAFRPRPRADATATHAQG
ncbi:MAG: prephenate dehydrogenase [Anaerolineae bacterium]